MDEPEETTKRSFVLSESHYAFLEKINSNTNLALRTVLDSIIKNEKRIIKKEIADSILMYVGVGLLLFIFSYAVQDYLIKIVAIVAGAFFFAYGAGGAFHCDTGNRKMMKK